MLTIARVICGAAFATFVVGTANAAIVDFPLNNPGDALTYTNVSTSSGPFSDEYSVTLGQDLSVAANIANTSVSPGPGCPGASCGFSSLSLSLYDSSHALLMSGLASFSELLSLSLSPYYIDVVGSRLGQGGTYTLNVSASADPVGNAPIPGAALLLISGLATLYGASRKKIGGPTAAEAEPTQA
jgi:hypothetical protein